MNYGLKKYDTINVQAYKYNGELYRQWNSGIVIEEDDEKIITYLFKTKVADLKTRNYILSEPTVWIFYKKEFYNAFYLLRSDGNYLYINMASPIIFEENTIKYIDFDLDLKDYPDKHLDLVDISEFKRNTKQLKYPKELVSLIMDTIDKLTELKDKHEKIFDRDLINNIVSNLAKDYLLVFREKRLKLFAKTYVKKNNMTSLHKSKKSSAIKIYTCGPTVYNSPHIGNMRPILSTHYFVKANLLLEIPTYFVHNITDIDDKIIKRAIDEDVKEVVIAKKYTYEYIALLKKYRIDTINKLVNVTKSLDTIKSYLNLLVKADVTYENEKGLLLDVSKIDSYGEAVNRDKAITEESNFYLWKKTEEGVKFRWNHIKGRPGWHSECSALINYFFSGSQLDYHGGGIDLKFPHHENENAQHKAIHGENITKNWFHTGHVNFGNDKMSKSLGNVILAKDFDPDVFKLMILGSSISGIININDAQISQQDNLIKKYKKILFTILLNNADHEYYSDDVREAIKFVTEMKFQKLLSSLDKFITLYNKNKDAMMLRKIYTLLNFIDFDWALKLKEDKHKWKQVYVNWQAKLNTNNYLEADQLREELIAEGLI